MFASLQDVDQNITKSYTFDFNIAVLKQISDAFLGRLATLKAGQVGSSSDVTLGPSNATQNRPVAQLETPTASGYWKIQTFEVAAIDLCLARLGEFFPEVVLRLKKESRIMFIKYWFSIKLH